MPKTKPLVRFSFRLDPELAGRVEDCAKRHGLNLYDYIRMVLTDKVNAEDEGRILAKTISSDTNTLALLLSKMSAFSGGNGE